MMIRLILLIATLWAPACFAQGNVDVSQALRSIHLDPAFRQNLRERGYTGDRFEIMIDHTRQLYADRAIVSGLARKIDNSLRVSGNRPSDVFFQSLDRALSEAYSTGLTRLSNSERRQLFAIDYAYVKSLPDRDCTKLLSGRQRPDRAQDLFDTFMVQISPDQLAAYHRYLRKATRLGLAKGASPRVLSAAETRRVEEALFPQIDAMIGQQKNAKSLYKAWAKGPKTTRKYLCTFNKMFAFSALNISGSTGDLAILYLMAN